MVETGPGRGRGTWEDDGPPADPYGPPGGRPRRPRSLVQEAAGNALLILAVCLIGFVLWFAFLSRLDYDRVQVESYATFRNSLALATAPTGPIEPGPCPPAASVCPPQVVPPGTPVAVLNIPEINLTTVVFQGTNGHVLEGGPGHLRDTPMPGQPGISEIFGRRTAYGGPFSRLPTLHQGEYFTVTTGQGVATYKVIDLRRAGDPYPPALAAGQGRLVLVTADGPPLAPTGVLDVDADLTSKPSPAPAMIVSSSDLGASEQALGIDSEALVPVVLWGFLLLAAAALLAWTGRRWGRWQTWIVAVPVVCFVSLSIADQVARLLPNLM
jgi:sortase A